MFDVGFCSCRKISATVPEIGEPMATPLSGWYIWFWKVKWFCPRMVYSSMMIWLAMSLSLCIRSWVSIMWMVLFYWDIDVEVLDVKSQ